MEKKNLKQSLNLKLNNYKGLNIRDEQLKIEKFQEEKERNQT